MTQAEALQEARRRGQTAFIFQSMKTGEFAGKIQFRSPQQNGKINAELRREDSEGRWIEVADLRTPREFAAFDRAFADADRKAESK